MSSKEYLSKLSAEELLDLILNYDWWLQDGLNWGGLTAARPMDVISFHASGTYDAVSEMNERNGIFKENVSDVLENTPNMDPEPTSADSEQKPVFLLCEEHEFEDGIREFEILEVSQDEDALTMLLEAKVEQDEYGLFAEYGFDTDSSGADLPYKTPYIDHVGYVEYYILEQPVQTKEQLLNKLQTPEYDTTFHGPEGLREATVLAVSNYMMTEGYENVDPHRVADDLLNNKRFQAMVKNAYWGRYLVSLEPAPIRALDDIKGFLADVVDDNKDYFVDIGAMKPQNLPENLRDMLTDALYTVCAEHRLPISSATHETDRVFYNPSFRAEIDREIAQPQSLIKGSEHYEKAFQICCEHVLKSVMPHRTPDSLESLLADARQRTDNQDKIPGTQHSQTFEL